MYSLVSIQHIYQCPCVSGEGVRGAGTARPCGLCGGKWPPAVDWKPRCQDNRVGTVVKLYSFQCFNLYVNFLSPLPPLIGVEGLYIQYYPLVLYLYPTDCVMHLHQSKSEITIYILLNTGKSILLSMWTWEPRYFDASKLKVNVTFAVKGQFCVLCNFVGASVSYGHILDKDTMTKGGKYIIWLTLGN